MAVQDLGPTHLFHVEPILSHGRVTLALEGELDIAGIDVLDRHVQWAIAQPASRLALDLRALTFIDATGVRAIAAAARAGGERVVVIPGPDRVQRVFELTGVAPALAFEPAPDPGEDARPESNVEYVQRLWHAFRTGGAEAMVRMVPEEARWRPTGAGGHVLRGRDELRSYWAAQAAGAGVRVTEFRAVGDDVLLRCEYPAATGSLEVRWSLYHFSAMTLEGAETYASEREALAHTS